MADTAALIISNRADGPQPDSASALFHRRIEFHQARKNFSGFVNESSNGFKLVTLNPTSDPVKPSGVGKKAEKSSEPSEAGLDPELSFEITFRRIGAGLRNLGNTCFLNSVLQCLTYTAPLAAYLQSGKHQNSCRTAGFCALCAIQKHVSRALQSTGRILEPKDLVSNLRCISRTFRNARQEDAHEYMVNLLESMHKCCLPSGVPSESPSAYEKSLVHKIFGGRLRSQVKCMQCSYCSNKFDPFLDLSLEITKAESLNKALGHFTAKEMLDGGAREYKCEQCKQKVKAFKQLTIHKAPEVLAVHLKRFSSLAPGQKIDRKVAFGPTLDLKPFVTGPYDGDLNYTLYGVLVHYGWSTHSGHYYCFVRTSSGMWYSLDDNQVVQVNERKVLEQKAYMLFYVRDRKNVGAKNHINARQKENMVINAIGNAAYLNGSISAALSGRDALGTSLPAKNLSSNLNGKLTAEHLSLVRNTNSDSLMVPATKAPLKDHSVMEMKSVDHQGDLCSRVAGTDCTSILGHIAGSITDKKSSVSEEQNTSANMMSDIERPQNSFHKKESINNSFAMPSGCKENGKEKPKESAEKQLSSSVLSTSCRDSLKMDDTISEMNTSKIIPVGASYIKTADSNTDDTVENGQSMGGQSKLLSELPVTTEPVVLGMTKKKGRDLKVRRKLFKFHVTTSLSSNIIFGVGLRSRKKKLRKKRHRSVQKTSTNPEDSLMNFIPSKLGQAATEESFPLADNCTSSQKKKISCDSDGKKQNFSTENVSGNCSISGDVDNEFRERILLNGSTLSARKRLQTRQSTAAQGTGESEECQRELMQTDAMSILTRGLEETTVGRWDDIGVTLSEKSETRASSTTAQIGHIGDEWDEEYDRGKRKKVRQSKMSFGGPNLFQEFANHKSKAKRIKLNRSGDGNQPFRIL